VRYYYSASNERALHLGLNLFYHNIIFLLRFRMVNILLPAYGRHYSALRGAGLAMAADEMENHELENLVLRERGVVWADQEEVGQQLKGERTGVDLQETNEVGSAGLCSELAPILSFSHLQYHQWHCTCTLASVLSLSRYVHVFIQSVAATGANSQ